MNFPLQITRLNNCDHAVAAASHASVRLLSRFGDRGGHMRPIAPVRRMTREQKWQISANMAESAPSGHHSGPPPYAASAFAIGCPSEMPWNYGGGSNIQVSHDRIRALDGRHQHEIENPYLQKSASLAQNSSRKPARASPPHGDARDRCAKSGARPMRTPPVHGLYIAGPCSRLRHYRQMPPTYSAQATW